MENAEVDIDIETVRNLHRKGKLHLKLRLRLYFLVLVTLVYGALTIFDILFRGLGWGVPLGFACSGFLLGLLVLSKLFSQVSWDEEKAIVALGRVDLAAVVLLGIYLCIRFVTKHFIDTEFHDVIVISGTSYAMFAGFAAGRLVATLRDVVQIHQRHRRELKS